MSRWSPQIKSVRTAAGYVRADERPLPMVPVDAAAIAGPRSELLAARWPTLGAALVAYQRNVAAAFAEEAYWCVEDGVIRMEERKRLAERAAGLGIRPFDAQLLIACALRDWEGDHQGRRRMRPAPPRGSHAWKWWTGAAVAALALDGVVIWLIFF